MFLVHFGIPFFFAILILFYCRCHVRDHHHYQSTAQQADTRFPQSSLFCASIWISGGEIRPSCDNILAIYSVERRRWRPCLHWPWVGEYKACGSSIGFRRMCPTHLNFRFRMVCIEGRCWLILYSLLLITLFRHVDEKHASEAVYEVNIS
jgi:hypothetical protein